MHGGGVAESGRGGRGRGGRPGSNSEAGWARLCRAVSGGEYIAVVIPVCLMLDGGSVMHLASRCAAARVHTHKH